MGDMNLAEKMIIEASKSGADICKFQTWSEKNLKSGPWDHDGRREIYKKAQLSIEDHRNLKNICEENSVGFMTSIFNINDLIFLEKMNMNMIKIPSHEIHNLDLIQATTKNFKTILVSTGAAKWEEIEKIMELPETKKLIFMHCVSTYPCPPEKINLSRMAELKKMTNIVGYSGHYQGIEDGIAAMCLGASYIEKHFTINHDLPGRDNKFAILPVEMKKLCDFRNKFEDMNINLGLEMQECEEDTFNNYRGRWSGNA